MKSGRTDMRPHFEEVQAHYDLSDEFFGLFQDPSRTYSCAYFEREDMTLAEAQLAKIDLALDKLDLQPGMTLLDVGCGWGSVMKRAVESYDVNVIGLTLSNNQYRYCKQLFKTLDTDRTTRVELHGWEEFDEPVDRIVSIEAFEAFPKERYAPFFEIVLPHPSQRRPPGTADDHGPPTQALARPRHSHRHVRPEVHAVHRQGDLPRRLHSLRRGHHRTLRRRRLLDAPLRDPESRTTSAPCETWAKNLEAAHDEAVAATSEEVYERYMKYLTGCADFFERGIANSAIHADQGLTPSGSYQLPDRSQAAPNASTTLWPPRANELDTAYR